MTPAQGEALSDINDIKRQGNNMTNQEYNGWTNYPTWNINLWMSNDSEYWDERAQEIWDNAKPTEYLTKSQFARFELADQLKDEFEELSVDNNGEAGPLTDILGWALSLVNWDEIADHLLDNIDDYESK